LPDLKNGLVVDAEGNKRWYKDSLLHREDGPAVEWRDGSKMWFQNGAYHRVDGPAIEWVNGVKIWWLNDERLGEGAYGFWKLWDRLTPEQRGNPNLLKYLPR